MRLNPVLEGLATYPFVRLTEAAAQARASGADVLDFGVGEPREETPAFIRRALADAVEAEPVSTYPLSEGLPELREAIVAWCELRFGASLDPATEVVPTLGSKEAIFHLAQVVAARGDRVAVTTPGYPVPARGAAFAGAEVARAAAGPGARLAARPRRGRLVRRRAAVAELPRQPDRGDRHAGAAGARGGRSRAATASSWPATRPTPSCGSRGNRRSAACSSRTARSVVVFNTLSKRSSMPGYRSGFVAGDPAVIAALKRYRPNVGVAPPTFIQRAAIAAWRDEDHVRETRARYGAKRDALLPALLAAGMTPAGGDASFFLWLAVDGDAEAFALALLRERGIVVAPGAVLRPRRRGSRARGPGADARGVPRGGATPRIERMTTLDLTALAARIEALYELPTGDLDPEAAADVERVMDLLDDGSIRVAHQEEDGWHVNEWAKKAILLSFRTRGMETIEVGPYEYHDKMPLKGGWAERGVRVVPPATVRQGAYVAPGAVLMPSYVNVGAWVGSGTMVDTWATVGSCAQIGADVHLSGGVGIGGVLEPLQAAPVVVEDGAFVGSRCIVVEGVRVGREAVLGANVVLTASTPIIDVTRQEAGRDARRGAAASDRHPRHAQEEVPRRQLPRAVRADHRRAPGLDGPQDVADPRAARARRQRLSAASSTSPAKTGTAQPVRSTCRSSPTSTSSSPPSMRTVTGESPPRSTWATAAPHAPVPDDAVSPTPRSKIRARMAPSPPGSGAKKLTLVRSGNRSLRSICAPTAVTSSSSTSRGVPSAMAHCGLPIETC